LSTLSQARTLGGVGSILVLLSLVPTIGVVLAIVGFILTLVAIKYISDALKDRSIFNNMLIAVILAIVGVAVGAVFVFASVFRFIGMGYFNENFMGQNFNQSTVPMGDLVSFITTILIGLLVIWVFYLISAVFLRRSYRSIAAKLNVGMFSTAALLYIIGAALTIVLVGFILIFVAQILLIVAFFSIPDQVSQPQ
jgi:uncharacterized membrane protein